MPRKRAKNIDTLGLTKEEKDEFAIVGFDKDEIEKVSELLKAETWQFWAKAKSLHLTLYSIEEIKTKGGKAVVSNEVGNAHFENSFFHTGNREIAKHVFMSNAYMEKRVMLMTQKAKADLDERYNRFRAAAFSDPENIKRLKEDIKAAEAKAKQEQAEAALA